MQIRNRFSGLKLAPEDPYFKLREDFNKDPHPDKKYIAVGEYRTNEPMHYIFQVVKEAEKAIHEDPLSNKEYVPIDGLHSFNVLARDLILGPSCPATLENRVVTMQTLAASGALVLAAEFLKVYLNPPCVYLSDPSWGGHTPMFRLCGHQIRTYPYWDKSRLDADFEGMMAELSRAPAGSVVVLHASAHNPTGVDPSPAMWDRLADFFQDKDLIIIFDCAYQGFANGDLDADVYSIRSFIRRGYQCLICQSLSKNIGIYSDRIGALHVVCSDEGTAANVLSQLMATARAMYSNPPKHGALIVERVLGNPQVRERWVEELRGLNQRIKEIRKRFCEELVAIGVPGDWSHIGRQVGMFAFTGLSPEQCDNMVKKWHCYMFRTGRLSIVGLTTENVNYIARAFKDSVENY